MSRDLKGKKVLITGGSSMIGRAIEECLKRRGAHVATPSHQILDLLDFEATYFYVRDIKPDYIIHAAGWNGGIEWNKRFPAKIFYNTSQMALNILTVCSHHKIDKVVSLISSCAYPSKDGELKEQELWEGLPNQSVECHGLSKRMLHAYSRQLYKQSGLNATTVVLNNCYGPHDSFHLEKTKVVAATIRKIYEAHIKGESHVGLWGTGRPTREFLYSLDAGEGIVRALMEYEDYDLPLNISTGVEISISELYQIIAEKIGFKGQIITNPHQQDGQMRKSLNIDRMKEILKWTPPTPFDEGIMFTIQWYLKNMEFANNKV